MCSWDRAEMMCPQTASLWGSTAAAANTGVILVASLSLFKESSSSSAWRGERKCWAWGGCQHATARPQTLAQCTAEQRHVKGNSTHQRRMLKCCICSSCHMKQTKKGYLLTWYLIFHVMSNTRLHRKYKMNPIILPSCKKALCKGRCFT